MINFMKNFNNNWKTNKFKVVLLFITLVIALINTLKGQYSESCISLLLAISILDDFIHKEMQKEINELKNKVI